MTSKGTRAEFRAWLKEQQAAYDQTVGQTPAAPVEHAPEQVSPAFRRRPHPLCELFPAMEGAAFDELVASIKENGLQEPHVALCPATTFLPMPNSPTQWAK
jgi:hypothetical protein